MTSKPPDEPVVPLSQFRATLARPRGMWQMRGAMLAIWDDLLPRVPQAEWEASRRALAAALAEDGGTPLV